MFFTAVAEVVCKNADMKKFNFGKYKDISVCSVIRDDVDYCIWVINNVQWAVFSMRQLMDIEKIYHEKHGCYPLKLTATACNIKHNGVCLGNISSEELYALYNERPDLQWAIQKVHNSRRSLKAFNLRQPVFQTDDL